MFTFRVMSFNIRGSFVNDGENAWPNRRDFVCELIAREDPDLIGFQEMQTGNWDDFQRLLPQFGRIQGPPYNNQEPFCYPSVFYNRKMFEPVADGQFYLSPTPEEFSGGWRTACIRSATWIRLHHREAGTNLLMLNTHLDHVSKSARLNGARLITHRLQDMRAPGEPIIVTADFNCDPDSPTYQNFARRGFIDTFLAAGNVDNPQVFTFHEFLGVRHQNYGRIDWILVQAGSAAVQASNARIIRDARPPVYPSDHYPVTVDLTVQLP